jgi:predicted acetyltransferase
MENAQVRLIEPTFELEAEFLSMAEEFMAEGDSVSTTMYAQAAQDFRAYVAKLQDVAEGRNLPDGWVRGSTYWLVGSGGHILGSTRLRHSIETEYLRYYGGHIGYDIRPSERGNGYGTAALSLTLEKARHVGLARVLLTCNANNAASRRIIEKCGGKFASQIVCRNEWKVMRRYWIEL